MEWRDIRGYEDYYSVSDTGLIKSKSRKCWNGFGYWVKPEKILKCIDHNSGYSYTSLTIKGKRKNFLIHRLVGEAFLGKASGLEINHINGNKRDNRALNLEWTTRSENMKHAFRTGLKTQEGIKNNQCKLDNTKVREIRELRKIGTTYAKIAQEFNVGETTVYYICKRLSWSHVV
jgi:hypothetical protein